MSRRSKLLICVECAAKKWKLLSTTMLVHLFSPSYVLWELGYWMFVYDAFFSHSAKTLPPPVWQRELSAKLLKAVLLFCYRILAPLIPVIHLSAIVSVRLPHITRKWCVLITTDPFFHSDSFLTQLHFSHRALIHILPFTDLPGPGWL